MDGGVMDCFFDERGDVATFSDAPKEPIPQVRRPLASACAPSLLPHLFRIV